MGDLSSPGGSTRASTQVTGARKRISVLCPVFNEVETIPIFHRRLTDALAGLRDRYDFEVIFTDNCSTDQTREVIRSIHAEHPEVQLVSLSRNFGYQSSLQAGLTYASGDAMVIIDADCEDPPEMIPEFIAKWEAGFDIVYGIRWDRPEPWAIKASRNAFYRMLQAVADMDIILYMAEFSLMSSHVRDATMNAANSFPFLRSEIGYVGFERCGIRYTRQARVAGKSHYNLTRMITFAGAGILTASTFVLRLPLYLLPGLLLANLGLLVWGADLGFKWLIALDLSYLATLATFGCLYLARIYKNGIGRPNFHVNLKRSLLSRRFPSTAWQARRSVEQDASTAPPRVGADMDSQSASDLLAYDAATRASSQVPSQPVER
ncbi:MAG: glycosyltransferase family 2 protein [Acidobacteriota bacterium]